MGVPVVIGNCVTGRPAAHEGWCRRRSRGHRSGSRLHIARCSGRGHPQATAVATVRPPVATTSRERPPCRSWRMVASSPEATSANASPVEPIRMIGHRSPARRVGGSRGMATPALFCLGDTHQRRQHRKHRADPAGAPPARRRTPQPARRPEDLDGTLGQNIAGHAERGSREAPL